MSNAFSAAGLYSTVEDLYRWDRALYTEELVSKGLLGQLFERHREYGSAEGVGYGWFVDKLRSHMRVTISGGLMANISRLIDDDIVIIALRG